MIWWPNQNMTRRIVNLLPKAVTTEIYLVCIWHKTYFLKACFTSVVRQPYTCLRRQISGFRAAVLRVVCSTARLPCLAMTQWQKLNFQHRYCPCDLMKMHDCRKTRKAAVSCCKTRKVFVQLLQELALRHFACKDVSLSRDNHAMNFRFIARLPQ